MHQNLLLHLNLLLASLLIVQLRLQTNQLFRLLSPGMGGAALFLAFLLEMIEPIAMTLLMELDVIVLWHILLFLR